MNTVIDPTVPLTPQEKCRGHRANYLRDVVAGTVQNSGFGPEDARAELERRFEAEVETAASELRKMHGAGWKPWDQISEDSKKYWRRQAMAARTAIDKVRTEHGD
jgi:hypothetical protein